MRINKLFKQIDIFGHQVSFNFNRKGSLHNTSIGGFFTLFIIGLISYLGITNLQLMFGLSNPSLSVVQSRQDFEKLGNVSYDDLNILLFYQLLDTSLSRFLSPK